MRALIIALCAASVCLACAAPGAAESASAPASQAGELVLHGRITMVGNAPFAKPVLHDLGSGKQWELRGLRKARAEAFLGDPVRVFGTDLSLDRAPDAFGLPAMQVRAIEKSMR